MQFSSIKKTTTKIQNALHLSINIFDTEVVFIEDIVFTDGTAVANVYVCLYVYMKVFGKALPSSLVVLRCEVLVQSKKLNTGPLTPTPTKTKTNMSNEHAPFHISSYQQHTGKYKSEVKIRLCWLFCSVWIEASKLLKILLRWHTKWRFWSLLIL